ncbi:11457_t:CDS:10 [Ambispora gerdemannii]|uniref:11457_t:CDS:1 n=1 Tax=Ambispora gerdemannii TaxID=144530 RepID=A0A9N9DZY7_9GLOM|nr:11457_t:CDS:10 [Ambispora gerdemannii]
MTTPNENDEARNNPAFSPVHALKQILEYFNRVPSKWNILNFLDEGDPEQFDQKIGLYLKSLEKISNKEKGERQQKALILLEKYRMASVAWCSRLEADLTLAPQGAGNLEGWPSLRLKAEHGARPDYHLARKWKSEHESTSPIGGPSVHLHNPTFTGNPLVGNSGSINGGTFKLSVESVPKRKKNNDHEKGDDKVPKRTKTIDKAENIDDIRTDSEYDEADLNYDDDLEYDDDGVDYSNYDIDPNIELSEKQIPVQSHLKYPNKDSPDNIWKLPSGKSIDKIIHGPKNLHKSHPSCLGIIRIGSKIRKPEWIKQEDWDYLNSSVEYPHYNLSTEVEDLFSVLLETNSLNEYKNCLYNVTFDREKNIGMTFVTDVLLWFAKNIFNTTSAFHSINKNEALLGSLMIHPVLQYLVNSTNHIIYVPGEIYLKASAKQRLLRRKLKPDDEPLGMKVDGLEIGMVELSGGYLTKDTPRYLKDHIKGNWGCRDLLNEIITKYNHGDYKILRRLRVWFFHIHGLEVQIWGMDLPVAKTYRMFLIGAFYLPISWDNHYELVHALRVLRNLRRGLDDFLEVLEELKKSHRRNTIIRFQSSTLKRYIGDAKSSPQKPTGKKITTFWPSPIAITNEWEASTKDISPLTESHSPEIEHKLDPI